MEGRDDLYKQKRMTKIIHKGVGTGIVKYILGFAFLMLIAILISIRYDVGSLEGILFYGCCGWFALLGIGIFVSLFMKKRKRKPKKVQKKKDEVSEETEDRVVKKAEVDEVEEIKWEDSVEVDEKDAHLDSCPKCGKNTLKVKSDGSLECKNCDYPKVE